MRDPDKKEVPVRDAENVNLLKQRNSKLPVIPIASNGRAVVKTSESVSSTGGSVGLGIRYAQVSGNGIKIATPILPPIINSLNPAVEVIRNSRKDDELREFLGTKPFTHISSLSLSRIAYSDPNISEIVNKTLLPKFKNVRVANWNVGASSELDKRVFIVLMLILKIDLIFVQETKDMNFAELMQISKRYNLHCLPPKNAFTERPSRGLFILIRKNLADFVCNPRGNVNSNCQHSNSNNKPSGGSECEYISIDIWMRTGKGQMRRFVCLYHGPQGSISCATGTVPEFLREVCPSQKNRKIPTLLMGDANLGRVGSSDLRTHFTRSMKERLDLTNALPLEWNTHQKSNKNGNISYTQPDVVYSNVDHHDLLVHKTVDPFALVRKVAGGQWENSSKYATNFIKKLDREKMTKGEFHYILIADFGTDVNKGNKYHCSPEGAYHCAPNREFHCQCFANIGSVGSSTNSFQSTTEQSK